MTRLWKFRPDAVKGLGTFDSKPRSKVRCFAALMAWLQTQKILEHNWTVQLSPFQSPHLDLGYIVPPQLEPDEAIVRAALGRLEMDLTKPGAVIESRRRDAAAGRFERLPELGELRCFKTRRPCPPPACLNIPTKFV